MFSEFDWSYLRWIFFKAYLENRNSKIEKVPFFQKICTKWEKSKKVIWFEKRRRIRWDTTELAKKPDLRA